MKKSIYFLCTALLIFCATPILAADPAQKPEINYSKLAQQCPSIFRGFERLDKEVLDGFDLFQIDSDLIKPKLIALEQAIANLDDDNFKKMKKDLKQAIDTPLMHSWNYYLNFLANVALFLSDYSKDVSHFFTLAGFPFTYHLLKGKKDYESIMSLPLDHTTIFNHVARGFTHQIRKDFTDHKNQIEKSLDGKSIRSNIVPILCTNKNDDTFGIYFLAYCYYKGIHPVPVSVLKEHNEIHGEALSSWGKVCHDLAHAQADGTKHSLKQYINNLCNTYTLKYGENFSSLKGKEKTQYQMENVIPHFIEFGQAVHKAYRESLFAMLEKSFTYYHVELNASKNIEFPDDFKAFVTGAFIHAHENGAASMANHYTSPDLLSLIESSLQEQIANLKIIMENEGQEQLSKTNKYIETSLIDGSCLLNDEEIIEKIKTSVPAKDFSGFAPRAENSNEENKASDPLIDDSKIVEWKVSRNKYYIQVKAVGINGFMHTYRIVTQYGQRNNLKHDRAMLISAKNMLKSKHNFDLPSIPKRAAFNDDDSYAKEVYRVVRELAKGRHLVLQFFISEAQKIIESEDNTSVLADQFSSTYTKALRKLKNNLPSFVGDLQTYICDACSDKKGQ